MTKDAIALATDSAVTVMTPTGLRHLRGQEKIYLLHRDPPIALIVYGSLDFADASWARIVDSYTSSQTQSANCDHLLLFAMDFMRWLQVSPALKNVAREVAWKNYLESVAVELLGCRVSEAIAQARELPETFKGNFRSKLIDEATKKIVDPPLIDLSGRIVDLDRQQTENAKVFREIAGLAYAKFDFLTGGLIDESMEGNLHRILAASTCYPSRFSSSGLVFAGFGRQDSGPSVVEFPSVLLERNSVRVVRPSQHPGVDSGQPWFARGFAESSSIDQFFDREGGPNGRVDRSLISRLPAQRLGDLAEHLIQREVWDHELSATIQPTVQEPVKVMVLTRNGQVDLK